MQEAQFPEPKAHSEVSGRLGNPLDGQSCWALYLASIWMVGSVGTPIERHPPEEPTAGGRRACPPRGNEWVSEGING